MISLQYLTSKWKSIALRYRKLATGYPRIPRHCFATLQRETKFATCIPFGYLDRKIFIDGGNDNKKKKWKPKRKEEKEKRKEEEKIWMEKPISWSRFEGNSSFNATRFIGESFNRTEFIIPRAKVCGNRKAPNTQMGFVGRFPVGNPKVSGFKFQLAILGQTECFGFAVFPRPPSNNDSRHTANFTTYRPNFII